MIIDFRKLTDTLLENVFSGKGLNKNKQKILNKLIEWQIYKNRKE